MNFCPLIQNPSNRRLILIFSGWSVDYRLFSIYEYPEGYDVTVVWDYSDFNCDEAYKAREYDETVVIAWSFGIAALDYVYTALPPGLNINCAIAVNGTLKPVDDLQGIPKDIFYVTKDSLSAMTLQSFHRRICGSGSRYNEFKQCLTTEPNAIDSLKSQLETFAPGGSVTTKKSTAKDDVLWDRVYISLDDRIFPAANMIRFWETMPTPVSLIQGNHLPDFQTIINTVIRNKKLIEKSFGKSIPTYDRYAEVQDSASHRLMELWNDSFLSEKILEVGSGSGILSRLIARRFPKADVTWIDIAGDAPKGCEGTFIHGDAEIIMRNLPDDNYDIVVSANVVQWFHSPIRFLRNAGRLLKKGGYLMFSTFAPGTLHELSTLNEGATLPYLSEKEWQKLACSAGLTVKECIVDKVELKFENGLELSRHLRYTGVNALTQHPRKDNFSNIRNLLDSRECSLTFHPIYLVMQK